MKPIRVPLTFVMVLECREPESETTQSKMASGVWKLSELKCALRVCELGSSLPADAVERSAPRTRVAPNAARSVLAKVHSITLSCLMTRGGGRERKTAALPGSAAALSHEK
jgi:hypothetical protein